MVFSQLLEILGLDRFNISIINDYIKKVNGEAVTLPHDFL